MGKVFKKPIPTKEQKTAKGHLWVSGTARNSGAGEVLQLALYHGNHDRKYGPGISYQLKDIYSVCKRCRNDAILKWKVHNWKAETICRKVLFSTDPYCQFVNVSQDMRHTKLFLLYPLSLVRWDRCV